MPDVNAALEHCKFLIEHGRGQEPAKLVLPRLEAQRRKANKEGRTRLIRDMHTSEAYSEWNAEFDRWITAAGGEPNIGCSLMLRALQQFPVSLIQTLAEDKQDQD